MRRHASPAVLAPICNPTWPYSDKQTKAMRYSSAGISDLRATGIWPSRTAQTTSLGVGFDQGGQR
jgi:hypothetical protein